MIKNKRNPLFLVSLFSLMILVSHYAFSAQDKGTAIMQITITANDTTLLYELNDSQAAKALYDQLPLTLKVEDYSNNEKIFYPPQKLKTADTPLAKTGQPGTLAYYAPWGDVVLFFGKFGSASGLYELGHIVAGKEKISTINGQIVIDKYSN